MLNFEEYWVINAISPDLDNHYVHYFSHYANMISSGNHYIHNFSHIFPFQNYCVTIVQ